MKHYSPLTDQLIHRRAKASTLSRFYAIIALLHICTATNAQEFKLLKSSDVTSPASGNLWKITSSLYINATLKKAIERKN